MIDFFDEKYLNEIHYLNLVKSLDIDECATHFAFQMLKQLSRPLVQLNGSLSYIQQTSYRSLSSFTFMFCSKSLNVNPPLLFYSNEYDLAHSK